MLSKRYMRFITKIFFLAITIATNTMFSAFYWGKYHQTGSVEYLVSVSTLSVSIVALLGVVFWLTMQYAKESVDLEREKRGELN